MMRDIIRARFNTAMSWPAYNKQHTSLALSRLKCRAMYFYQKIMKTWHRTGFLDRYFIGNDDDATMMHWPLSK